MRRTKILSTPYVVQLLISYLEPPFGFQNSKVYVQETKFSFFKTTPQRQIQKHMKILEFWKILEGCNSQWVSLFDGEKHFSKFQKIWKWEPIFKTWDFRKFSKIEIFSKFKIFGLETKWWVHRSLGLQSKLSYVNAWVQDEHLKKNLEAYFRKARP